MENSNGGVQSVARIFALIEVLCAHPKGASLQTISAESGLPKSTAHRLLSSLVSLGYAVQDSFSTHYRLTMKMFELSSGIVNDMDIMSVAKPHLDKLSRHTGEAVHLVIQDGVDIVYIYKAEAGAGLGGMRMSSHVGLRIPMYCTGVGKAILATQSYGEAERVWRKSSIRGADSAYHHGFRRIHRAAQARAHGGLCHRRRENELGIRCVALAVPGMNGRAGGGVQHLGPCRADDGRPHRASGAYGPCRAARYSARPRLEVDRGIQAQTGAAQNKIIINNRRRENTKKEKTRSEAAFRFASGRVFCCLCFLRAVLHRARFLCYCASRVSTAPGCVITRSPLCISSVSASCAKKT